METNIEPGIYKHFKGEEFEVLAMVSHSETLEPMVLYKHLEGVPGLWVRPATMWSEEVDRPELGYKGPRFTFARKTSGMGGFSV
jgi:hypothetical protein